MRAYIRQHKGVVKIGRECDICWAEVAERMSLVLYLKGYEGDKYSFHTPNLCPDHGRELGVAW